MFFEWGICFGWGYGHVFATYGWRLWGVFNTPLHLLHVINQNTAMFFEPDARYPSKYERVIRTGNMFWLGIRPCFRHLRVAFVGRMLLRPYTSYMPYIEIRTCYSNREYVSVGNTDMFSELSTRYPSKYGNVSQTGYTLSIEIRKRFSNRAHVIHQNTNVFSESGEGVDEPEDGEEDDGGAYDAVQYADAANVEPSAEA